MTNSDDHDENDMMTMKLARADHTSIISNNGYVNKNTLQNFLPDFQRDTKRFFLLRFAARSIPSACTGSGTIRQLGPDGLGKAYGQKRGLQANGNTTTTTTK